MKKKIYDAIVVGAGHNGLTAASYMAKAGLDVLVLEKNDYIGEQQLVENYFQGGNIQTVLMCVVYYDLK